MAAAWSTEDGELHLTGWDLGGRGAVCAKVESMGEVGWDWHAWDAAGRGRPHYGLADTLDEAKQKEDVASAVTQTTPGANGPGTRAIL